MSEGMRPPLSLQPHAQQVSKPEKPRKTSKILPWGAKVVWRAPKTLGLQTDMTKTEKEARARLFSSVGNCREGIIRQPQSVSQKTKKTSKIALGRVRAQGTLGS